VLLGRLLRHQQQEDQTDRLAVGRRRTNRLRQRTKAPTASFRPLILPCEWRVPDQASRAETLAANKLSNTRLLAP